jgi:cyclohexanecarboxylate-CoA ligase
VSENSISVLKHGEAKVIIAPKTFRGFDFEAMISSIQPNLPDLKHIVVVDGQGANSFDKLLSGPEWEEEADRSHHTSCKPTWT